MAAKGTTSSGGRAASARFRENRQIPIAKSRANDSPTPDIHRAFAVSLSRGSFGGGSAGVGELGLSTGAMNRYPRRGRVSTNLGLSASSPNAIRILVIAVLSAWSKSTNVSSGQTCWRSSSRADQLARTRQQDGADLKRLALQGHLYPILAQFPSLQVRFKDSETNNLRRTLTIVHVEPQAVGSNSSTVGQLLQLRAVYSHLQTAY